MDYSVHNKIVSFIWSIADDCLRDVYVRGKYCDVILPMFVLRRLDCLLEITKSEVEDEVKFQREEVKLAELDPNGLRDASGYIFYNISPWTLQRLVVTATNSQSILEMNFKAYLDGFSNDVKEIIEKFNLRAQIKHMAEKDVLLDVLEKFTNPYINLTPNESQDPDGRKLPPLTNLGMGYVFEELIRKFNEENNEEAGEHFTPREVIDLMTHLVFEPVKNQLPPVITIYDPACGSGGMLTESQNFIIDPNGRLKSDVAVHLYGKEINDETYAICKSDMMIKGNDPEHIQQITQTCIDFINIEKQGESSVASKLFDNRDFGYYKVTIERPRRKAAQLTKDRIASLRFDSRLTEPMQWIYEKFGAQIYSQLAEKKQEIESALEKEDITLNTKQRKTLFSIETWEKQKQLLEIARNLMDDLGQELHLDFNLFREKVLTSFKSNKVKSPSKPGKPIQSSDINQIFNAISWYEETAEKVIAKKQKLKGEKLDKVLDHLNCQENNLKDYGYWPSDKAGEWIQYETESTLRDFENIPLKDNIHAYFLKEVRPHMDEAWINLDQTKIGYEISFNKYFYQHKPLRSLEAVTADIMKLESETEGLLKKLIQFTEPNHE